MSVTDFLKTILLGIIQGITEWLPISSTGHMILLQNLLRLDVSETFWNMFLVVIQFGSILAVVCLFWRRLWPFFPSDPARTRRTLALWGRVLIAIIPSGVVGVLLDDWLDAHLFRPVVVAAALIIYGVLYLFMEKLQRHGDDTLAPENLPLRTAFAIGTFQILALIPGTSRSGSTILGATLLGLSRIAAAEFSFFMAVPTMAGAGGIKMLKFLVENDAPVTGREWMILGVGCAVAFFVSLCVIRYLLDFVKRHTFAPFGWYRIALGLVVFGCALADLI